MAPTTYRSFVDALEAMSVTGVDRDFTQGPPLGAPGVADCPFKYIRYPGGDERPIVFGSHGGWPTLTAEVVIGIEPVGQKDAGNNFDDTVDLMDALNTALRALACITKSKLNWNIRQTIDTVAGQQYWAVVARVEGSG